MQDVLGNIYYHMGCQLLWISGDAMAEKWFDSAAKYGNQDAKSQLKIIYHNRILDIPTDNQLKNAMGDKNPEIYLKLGQMLYAVGNISKAKENFEKAAQLKSADGNFKLGMLNFNQGDIETARKNFKIASGAGNSEAKSMLEREEFIQDIKALDELAHKYYNNGNLVLAEKFFSILANKNHVNAVYHLGIIYYKEGRIKIAKEKFLQAGNAGEYKAYYELAKIYYKQCKYSDAEKYFLLSAEKGNIYNAYIDLGVMKFAEKNFAEAEKFYKLAAENGLPDAYYALGSINFMQENSVLAKDYFLKALDSNNSDAREFLSFIYNKEGKSGIFDCAEKNYNSERPFSEALAKCDILSGSSTTILDGN